MITNKNIIMNDIQTILIVDDNPENIRVLSGILKEEKYNVRMAINGEQAVKSVNFEKPDLILLDIQMPVMDGYEACRIIKSSEENKSLPIIFISALSDTFDKVEAFNAGGVDYIPKPFHIEEVLARVRTHLLLKRSLDQLEEININLYRELQDTFDQTAVGFVHTDLNNKITKVNNKFCELLGFPAEELLGTSLSDYIHHDYLEIEQKNSAGLISGKSDSYIDEYVLNCKIRNIWGKVTASLQRNKQNNPLFFIRVFEDINSQKEADKKIRQSENKFRNLFNSSADSLLIVDNKHKIIQTNKQLHLLLGYEEDELIGKEVELLVPQAIRTEHITLRDEYNKSPHTRMMGMGLELFARHKNGREIPVEISLGPHQSDQGPVILTSIRDISGRKTLEKEKERLMNRLTIATETAKIGIWDWNIKDDIVTWNENLYKIYDIKRGTELKSVKRWENRVHPDDHKKAKNDLEKALESKSHYHSEYRILWEDQSIHFIEGNATIFRDDNGDPERMVGADVDVTEQKIKEIEIIKLNEDLEKRVTERTAELQKVIYNLGESEKQVKKSEAHLNGILSALPDAIFIYDEDARYVDLYVRELNDADSARMQDYEDDINKAIGQTVEEAMPPDVAVKIRNAINEVIGTESTVRIEYELSTTAGLRWYDSRYVLMPATGNDKKQIVSLARDITERKEMEKALLSAKDVAEKATRTKGDFLANMSHEIRTPMNGILGMTHLCLQTDLNSKQRNYLNKVYNSGNALLEIINDILDFSKIEAGKLSIEKIPFQLSAVLENLSTMISLKAQEKELELLFHSPPSIPDDLIGDPLRLGQILLNLTSNAIKFTEKGEVIVEVELLEKDESKILLRFAVRDSGIGLSSDQMSKLFQSFTQADTSTTRKFGGTGLGLAISKNLVELMNGQIGVESTLGEGSTFFFTAKFKIGKTKVEKKQTSFSTLKNLNVLVVDDNEKSLQILSETLQSFDFQVTCVNSGIEALKTITKVTNGKFDLVLMDWQMPELDGIETARRMHKMENIVEKPKIILITAFSREELIVETHDIEFDGILIKPVSSSDLLDAIMVAFGQDIPEIAFSDNKNDLNIIKLKPIMGAHILLVEDNLINQEVACDLLKNAGFFVEIADNGKIAIDKITSKDFDIVLMDIQMPVMDGYTATEKLRQNKKFKELPIIAMTADALLTDRDKALEIGMNAHISKPIIPNKLYEMLLKYIKPLSRKIPDYYIEKKSNLLDADSDDFIRARKYSGLDLKLGMQHTNNKIDLYLSIINKFRRDYSSVQKDMETLLENKNHEEAQRYAHSLKSVAGNIGATKIQEYASKIESSLKSNNFSEFKSTLTDLEHSLNIVLKSIDDINDEPLKKSQRTSKTEVGSTDILLGLLKELKPFIEKGKIKPSKDKVNEIVEYKWPDKYQNSINKIEILIKKYKLSDADPLLDKLIKDLMKS